MKQWGGTIIYLLFLFAIIYFMMIRPQKKQQKQRREMMESLKVNDSVVTIGGIHGKIVKIKDDRVTLKLADKVEVNFERSAISKIAGKEEQV